MNRRPINSPRGQCGAVLVVSLIMLAVLTLFVISMIKTSIVELKIGGASQTAALNMSAADAGIDNFLSLNSGRFAPNWLTLVGAAGPVAGSLNYTAAQGAYSALGSSVIIVATQVGCGASKQNGAQIGPGAQQAVQFDIAATASGAIGIGGQTVVHQGVQALAPSGACP
jgi:hypothetical protein